MVQLLDGAMTQALRQRSPVPDDPLWAAKQLLAEPETVRAAHEAFLEAGAQIITTNTYLTNRWRLNRHGAWQSFAAVNRAAGEAAEAARERVNPGALIAGALPPLRQSYRADLVLAVEEAVVEYAEHALVLAPYVDLFIAETMVTAEEARGAAEAALATG
ncbi:MAG: homocysteine S-methyltransferase family protein, partial [Pseudomonadota bacterium]